MAAALPWLKPQFCDANGKPYAGGKVWIYQAGTNIPRTSYTDSINNIPNPNPFILDAAGRGDFWLAPGSYKVVLMDKNDVMIWTKDNVKPNDGGGGGIIDDDYAKSGYSLRFNEDFTSTGLNDTLDKILKFGYLAPTIGLSGSSNILREKGVSVGSITLTAAIVKRADPIAEVKFYRNPSTLLDTQTSGGAIPNGGNSTYVYSAGFSDNVTFRAEVKDNGATGGPTTVQATTTYNFVYPYFYGPEWTGGGIPAPWNSYLTKDVIASTASVNRSFTLDGTQKMEFAYPQAYGPLAEILDVSNFNTLPDWTLTTKTYNALDGSTVNYNHYKFNNIPVAGTYSYTFKR